MDFFRKKRVLVTGCTGFKGSWLSGVLLQMGAEVCGYALPVEPDAFFHMLRLEKKMCCCFADIRDRDRLERFLKEKRPEIVFHLAAQPIIQTGYQAPADTFEVNVMGTVNLLEAVRKSDSVRSVVNVTTDKVYKNYEWEWGYRETDPLGGGDPYSASKACSELVTQSYIHSFFTGKLPPVSTMRAGNVIGGGDFAPNRILPDCVRAAVSKVPIAVRNPASVRPYQYVLEALHAYLLLAQKQWEKPELAGSYNVGPDAESCISTGRLAEIFCKLWGEGAAWETHGAASMPPENYLLRLDNSRIRARLDWRPLVNLAEAMEFTVHWYKAFTRGDGLEAYTEREIHDYFSRRG